MPDPRVWPCCRHSANAVTLRRQLRKWHDVMKDKVVTLMGTDLVRYKVGRKQRQLRNSTSESTLSVRRLRKYKYKVCLPLCRCAP